MNIYLVARITLGEAARRKILLAGLAVTVAFLSLYATGVHFAVKDIARSSPGEAVEQLLILPGSIFLVLGVFVASMVGALVAAFTAVGSISTEVEQGTLQTIAARPVTRRDILVGKFLGHGLLLAVYLSIFFFALVGIVYIETGWHPSNLPLAAFVVMLQALVILAAAMLGSTFLSAPTNGVIILLLYATALIGGFIEQIGVLIGRQVLYQIGVASSLAMPTDTLYRYAVHLLRPERGALGGLEAAASLGPFGAASPPSVWALVYALAFILVMLSAATAVLSRRDL